MDIFALAQQGMDIQAQEKKELEAEQAAEAKTKSFKLDIFEMLKAAASKDYDWYKRLGENSKAFSPHMLNLWMGMVWNSNNTKKAFNNNDLIYADIVKKTNFTLNRDVYAVPKEMFWLLACTVQEYNAPFSADYKKLMKRDLADKIPAKVINYMSQELYSSKDKIMDMIDNGLITEEEIKAIISDFETLEEQKIKRK